MGFVKLLYAFRSGNNTNKFDFLSSVFFNLTNGIHSGSQLQVSTQTGSITLPAVIAPLAPNTVWLPECSAGSTVRQSLGGGQGLIVNLSEVK